MKALKFVFGLLGVTALYRLIVSAISGTMVATDLVPMREAVVEFDIGGVGTWAAVETWMNMVDPSRGTVPTSEEKALDGSNFLGYGTPGNATVNFTFFATQDTTDPYYNLQSQLGEIVDIRWSKSGAASELRHYTSQGVLTALNAPGFDANNNQSTKVTGTITAADINVEVIPT